MSFTSTSLTGTPQSGTPQSGNVVDLGFGAFDADNHYYEAEDAFTRHIPRDMAKRCMQWAEIEGKKRLLVGGRVNRFIPNPTFDPVSKPGALDAYFRGRVAGGDMRKLARSFLLLNIPAYLESRCSIMHLLLLAQSTILICSMHVRL